MAAFEPSPERVGQYERPAPVDARGCVHLAREMVAARWGDAHCTPSTGLRIGLLYGPGHDQGSAGLVARAVAAAMETSRFSSRIGMRSTSSTSAMSLARCARRHVRRAGTG
jgi:nucleoside-diphosphate-sugar epimerase